ncbi:TRAP transporter small permease [Bradyrhizobium sp. G127]|uniref:TRAP transporter small permease n=1 Tax=Bradyrhizobium sp. G127 TaxID=2904800 RepID=UPI001F45BA90|nr:TRAP transporter small permease [Bradyrhizobium sp. G127]MCF2522637.1 TRAP transporter small permease [Bradyrhizobium sp. G127]
MKLFLRILDRLEETLIATLIAAATIVIFIAVAHRYTTDFVVTHRTWPGAPQIYTFLAGIHLSWAQELCIYMFVWMAKFGAAYGVRTGIHVGVDVLVLALSERWRRATILFGLLCGALFTGIIGTMGASFVIGLSATDQTSPDLELPSWIVYLCIPLGSYLMCFRFLQVAWAYWRTGDLPHHDHTHVEGIEVDTAVGPTPEGVR